MSIRLTQQGLWKRLEERVCEVLAYALKLLQNRSDLIQDENELNRELSFCLREANAYFYSLGRGLDSPFYYEARNQPSSELESKHPREDKRPDFQCGYVDHSETNSYKQDKFFCVECKRLGFPPSETWILNKNYVHNGIVRFIEENYGYGMEVAAGAMVGYVESSDFAAILLEVNANIAKFLPTVSEVGSAILARDEQLPTQDNDYQESLVLQGGPEINLQEIQWTSTECNLLENTFKRSFPISPFTLKHFWIDLRGRLNPISEEIHAKKPEKNPTNSKAGTTKKRTSRRRKQDA